MLKGALNEWERRTSTGCASSGSAGSPDRSSEGAETLAVPGIPVTLEQFLDSLFKQADIRGLFFVSVLKSANDIAIAIN